MLGMTPTLTVTATVTAANFILLAIGLYALIGLVFGLLFVARGVGALDAGARGGSVGFRLLALPGAVALWPWLMIRWRGMSGVGTDGPPPHRMSDEPCRRRTGDARVWQSVAWWFVGPFALLLAFVAVRGLRQPPPVPAATFEGIPAALGTSGDETRDEAVPSDPSDASEVRP